MQYSNNYNMQYSIAELILYNPLSMKHLKNINFNTNRNLVSKDFLFFKFKMQKI